MQTIGSLQMVSETHNDNILGNNNDSGNGRADQVRAFRIRVGGEELVAISTQVWDPAIRSMLPSLPQKIVRLLVLGKGQQEVADELGIQLQTVSNSVHALYKREDGLADTMAHLASKLYPPLFKIKYE